MSTSEIDKKLAILSAYVVAGLAFLLVFAVTVMGWAVWQSSRLSANAAELRVVATETHDSLCAFKADLQERYRQGQEYIKDHPAGLLDSRGQTIISRDQIAAQQTSRKDALDSLRELDCG
jgi:Flp pilus assembly protein TadB